MIRSAKPPTPKVQPHFCQVEHDCGDPYCVMRVCAVTQKQIRDCQEVQREALR